MTFKRGDGYDLYSGITTGGFPLNKVYTFGRSGYQSGGGAQYSLITGRFGGQALRIADTGSIGVTWVNRPLTASRSALTTSSAVRRNSRSMASTSSGAAVMRLRNLLTSQLTFGVDFLGRVCVWVDPTATLAGRSTEPDQVLEANWHTWEIEVEGMNTSGGRVGVWIDGGREALGLTSLDLTGMSANDVDSLELCMQTNGANNISCDFDDWYELDVATRLLQPIKAETLRPNVDIGPNDATPTSGSDHFAMIDDTTGDGDTTALTFNVGDVERVGLTALSTVPAAIYALQAITVSRKTDAGLVQQTTSFVSGPTTETGHTQTLGIDYAPEYDVAETDPDTTAAWNATGVNAVELEIERTA